MIVQKPRFGFLAALVLLTVVLLDACAITDTEIPAMNTLPASGTATGTDVVLFSPILSSPLPTPSPMRFIAKEMATAIVPNRLTKEKAAAIKARSGTALVVGRLLDSATQKPAGGIWLYLGEVIGPEDSPQVVFDVSRAQVTISNENGVFYFQDVLPGRYAIVLWTPATSFLLSRLEDESPLLFSVMADEVKILPDLASAIPY